MSFTPSKLEAPFAQEVRRGGLERKRWLLNHEGWNPGSDAQTSLLDREP